jgi:hypothetical protein
MVARSDDTRKMRGSNADVGGGLEAERLVLPFVASCKFNKVTVADVVHLVENTFDPADAVEGLRCLSRTSKISSQDFV